MASMPIQNYQSSVRGIYRRFLRQIDSLQPLNTKVVIGPAIGRCGILPVGHFFELKKPLFLKLFAIEVNSRSKNSAVCSDTLDE